MFPSRRGKESFGADPENTVSALRQGRFCMAPHDIPRHFALGRMIAIVRIKRSRTRFSVPFFCVPKDKPIHWRYVLQRTAGFEPAITVKRGVEPHRTGPWRKPRSTRLPCASHPRHTLWQSLAHRCGFIHTRCWCLAGAFYHIVGWDSRKKSCELHEISVNSLAITRFFMEILFWGVNASPLKEKGTVARPPDSMM